MTECGITECGTTEYRMDITCLYPVDPVRILYSYFLGVFAALCDKRLGLNFIPAGAAPEIFEYDLTGGVAR
jgi:hypothetical protein